MLHEGRSEILSPIPPRSFRGVGIWGAERGRLLQIHFLNFHKSRYYEVKKSVFHNGFMKYAFYLFIAVFAFVSFFQEQERRAVQFYTFFPIYRQRGL